NCSYMETQVVALGDLNSFGDTRKKELKAKYIPPTRLVPRPTQGGPPDIHVTASAPRTPTGLQVPPVVEFALRMTLGCTEGGRASCCLTDVLKGEKERSQGPSPCFPASQCNLSCQVESLPVTPEDDFCCFQSVLSSSVYFPNF
ncbi:hypothetical protein STEG23_008405, partial [Scotinomys teguina]